MQIAWLHLSAKPLPLDQIAAWLNKDFDGVIAFDEAHNLGNVFSNEARFIPTRRQGARWGAPANAAAERAHRLRVGHRGHRGVEARLHQPPRPAGRRIGVRQAGRLHRRHRERRVAAKELVSRDMKAAGRYLARSLSFDGVTYERIDHNLTPLQTDIYTEMAVRGRSC